MEQALRRAQRAGGGVGLMFLDADRFKDINDQYGHEFGDVVLRGIANRVQSVLRDSDTMVRLGGDEFVVVCEDVANAIALDALAARVALAVSAEPFVSVGASAMVTCSVGVAYADPENLDIELFLRSADGAMYDAKRAGRGRQRRVIVDGRPDRMVAGVRRAIERGTLPMALQPIRDPRTGVDIGWAVDVALESRPRTLSALHALSADPATMRAFAGLAIRHAVNVAHLQPAGVLQVHVPLIALADAGVRESLLAEIEASGVPIDRFAFAVDAMGVRSERTLLSVHEKTDGRLRFALLRFGAESLDLGALVELHPDVCEVDAEMVTGARQDERLNATCAVAHAIGARSQVQGLALGSDVPGIDQVRAPAGEKLQWLDPLPIGR
jgi:diguanylate cyclase (GGDEF)-like protein